VRGVPGSRYPYRDRYRLAQNRKATLVTSDKDFECVGTALKTIWV
jgi:hypothetical protein